MYYNFNTVIIINILITDTIAIKNIFIMEKYKKKNIPLPGPPLIKRILFCSSVVSWS